MAQTKVHCPGSWLQFNQRVLHEVLDEAVGQSPALGRVACLAHRVRILDPHPLASPGSDPTGDLGPLGASGV